MKPAEYQLDPTIGPSTDNSLKWAEKQMKTKFTEPDLKAAKKLKKLREAQDNADFSFEDDNDMTSTLASAKWAEDNLKLNEAFAEDNKKKKKKERDWENFLARDQFDGMRQIGEEVNKENLDRQGIAPGPLNERIADYEIKKGTAIASSRVSMEDKAFIKELKGDLSGKKEEFGTIETTQETPKAPVRRRFQLSPEEMKEVQQDIKEDEAAGPSGPKILKDVTHEK